MFDCLFVFLFARILLLFVVGLRFVFFRSVFMHISYVLMCLFVWCVICCRVCCSFVYSVSRILCY